MFNGETTDINNNLNTISNMSFLTVLKGNMRFVRGLSSFLHIQSTERKVSGGRHDARAYTCSLYLFIYSYSYT